MNDFGGLATRQRDGRPNKQGSRMRDRLKPGGPELRLNFRSPSSVFEKQFEQISDVILNVGLSGLLPLEDGLKKSERS
jgi:hypothetical protein